MKIVKGHFRMVEYTESVNNCACRDHDAARIYMKRANNSL